MFNYFFIIKLLSFLYLELINVTSIERTLYICFVVVFLFQLRQVGPLKWQRNVIL